MVKQKFTENLFSLQRCLMECLGLLLLQNFKNFILPCITMAVSCCITTFDVPKTSLLFTFVYLQYAHKLLIAMLRAP